MTVGGSFLNYLKQSIASIVMRMEAFTLSRLEVTASENKTKPNVVLVWMLATNDNFDLNLHRLLKTERLSFFRILEKGAGAPPKSASLSNQSTTWPSLSLSLWILDLLLTITSILLVFVKVCGSRWNLARTKHKRQNILIESLFPQKYTHNNGFEYSGHYPVRQRHDKA